MRIEKIELIGFKSFAEKTTFQLHPGITCIVGPNGAGKSNIVDSFRWVLGEQSAKSLRGEKMEEVIFNGSATKKPRGMSEVNLIISFDSPEQGNGGSQTLTSVARRLYRSGESEYLVNRNQCRLRDIRDLFLDTGLEIKSYSILEQGKIGEIINAKPQDRRFLIEEVAGVMKYKVRKAEALSKLESSRLNLQRINDIVSEVKRQINSLDRQVRKAERYKKLSTEVRLIELKLAKRDYTALRESLEKLLADCRTLKEEEATVRAELHTVENARETKRIALLEREKFLETVLAELQDLEKGIAEAERGIAVSTTEQNSLREYMMKLSLQEAETFQRIADLERRKGDLDALAAEGGVKIESLKQELSEKNEALRGVESDLSEKEELIEAKRKEMFRLAEAVSHLKNEGNRFQTALDTIEKKHESVVKETEAAQEELDVITTSLKGTDQAIVGRSNELLLLKEKRAQLTSELTEGETRLDALRTTLAQEREGLASSDSRLASLREILHEDLSREVLTEHVRVLASIAEVIEVEEAYEKAIENALAEKIKGYIVQSQDEVTGQASLLKEQGMKRTVFVPLDMLRNEGGDFTEHDRERLRDHLIGKAGDFVRIQKGQEGLLPAITSLLGDILVAKDLPAALALVREVRATVVTIDGETVEPSGAVTVGEGSGILRRRREIKELESRIGRKKEEIAHISTTMAEREEGLRNIVAALKDFESLVIDAEKEISLLRLTAQNQNEEKDRISRRLAHLNLEREELIREKESLGKLLVEKSEAERKAALQKETAEQLVSSLLDAIAAAKNQYETERASGTELRLSLNSATEKLETLQEDIADAERLHAEHLKTTDTLAQERGGIEQRIIQCETDIAVNNDVLRGLVVKADAVRRVIEENRETIRTESEDVVHLEQNMKTLRTRVDSLTRQTGEADVLIAEHKIKLENLAGNIRQSYDVAIEAYESEPVQAEDEERLAEIRGKIQELGPVNLGTLEEYEELKTRYEFLTKQQDDLVKSIAELEEAITKINTTTRKRLREAFEQLNAKFSEVFTALFAGGKAGLVMTDEQNILESGIDIIAQPTGKRLQNIHLLSGGEKALTALALLFASFLIKPSPLCVLDEVDAALDDANIERFAKMLKELSANIQFIIITHNRMTMECADYIYGITMEEPGISKVISMQLADTQTA